MRKSGKIVLNSDKNSVQVGKNFDQVGQTLWQSRGKIVTKSGQSCDKVLSKIMTKSGKIGDQVGENCAQVGEECPT